MARYHECFIASPVGRALVLEVDGRPAGFLLGWTDGPAHGAWVTQSRGRELARAGAVALAVRPHLWVGFATTRARRYATAVLNLRRRPSRTGSQQSEPRATLAHLAVEPRDRGTGLGTHLLLAFEAELERCGVASAHLRTTDAAEFYLARGWRVVGTSKDMDGIEHAVLERDFPPVSQRH